MRLITLTRRRSLAALAAVLAATLAAGCGGASYTHFRPAGDYQGAGADWVAKRVYHLPPGRQQVEVHLAARGRTDTTDKGVAFETLNVRLTIKNKGDNAFTLTPADIGLLDDEGNTLTGAEAYAGRNRTGTITVAGGAQATYELVFDLPPETHLADLGSVRIRWPYTCDAQTHTVTTKFLRIEEVYYYRPGYYYPYGPPYHYDPWYYDYWYGPGWRPGFGSGYFHHW